MLKVVDTLVPVLLIMALGFALCRSEFLKPLFISGLYKLIYWVLLPAFVIYSLSVSSAAWWQAGKVFSLFLLASTIVALLGWLLCRRAGISGPQMGSFLQGVFRGNLALIGLPILMVATPAAELEATVALGVLVLAPTMLTYNLVSVLLFTFLSDSTEKPSVWQSLLSLRSNPLILATALGLLLMALKLPLPTFLTEFTRIIGQTAGSLALLCIGASLALADIRGTHWVSLAAVSMKIALLPLVAWLIAMAVGLDIESTRLLVFYAATPTAVAAAIVAKQMGGDEALSSSIVALSTVLSLIPMGVLIALYF
jgi:predicted permease